MALGRTSVDKGSSTDSCRPIRNRRRLELAAETIRTNRTSVWIAGPAAQQETYHELAPTPRRRR